MVQSQAELILWVLVAIMHHNKNQTIQAGVTVHLAGSWGTNTINSLDLGGTSANAKYRTAANGTLDNGNLNVTDMATNCFVRACFCYQSS